MAWRVLTFQALVAISVDAQVDSIRFLQVGDWGGRNVVPYSTPSQNHTSVGMATIAAEVDSQFIIALGDNFYSYGITTNVEDARFAQTWHSIYTEASLQTPWYVCAGNHDHRGNVTAQIAYTAVSDIWEFPSLYHSHSFSSADGNVTVDIILIDTTNYTGVNSGNVYPSQVADPAQQAWIEAQLKGSTADYIIVAGHYPGECSLIAILDDFLLLVVVIIIVVVVVVFAVAAAVVILLSIDRCPL